MKRGFTLIELLVVIAILAVLAVAVVVVLNPAELLRQGRDSTRISDLAAVNSALAMYIADVVNPVLGSGTTGYCTSGTTSKGTQGCTNSSTTAVSGTGWVSVDFTDISSGSPLARLPVDPNNGSTNCGAGAAACFYQYLFASSTVTYELDCSMESQKYMAAGGSDMETTDGGNSATTYELGNDPGLDL